MRQFPEKGELEFTILFGASEAQLAKYAATFVRRFVQKLPDKFSLPPGPSGTMQIADVRHAVSKDPMVRQLGPG